MHIDGKRKSLVPLLLKNHDFENITLSLLKWDFKKQCLFNKSNNQSMHILHYHTFYRLCTQLLGWIIYYHSFFRNRDF